MNSDTAISAVRAARERISRRFDDDPEKLVEFYIEYQKRFQDRLVVDRPPVTWAESRAGQRAPSADLRAGDGPPVQPD